MIIILDHTKRISSEYAIAYMHTDAAFDYWV